MGLLGDKRPMSWYDPGKFWSGDEVELEPPFRARRRDLRAVGSERRCDRRGPDGRDARPPARALDPGRLRWWRSATRPARRGGGRAAGRRRVHADALELIADPGGRRGRRRLARRHARAVRAACIAAGKPVLCEKPLATSAAGAALRDRRGRARRPAAPGHGRLHAPSRPGLRRPEGGASTAVRSARRCSSTARTATSASTRFFDSAMIITDSAVHEIDVARWLLGDEIGARDRARPAPVAPRRVKGCATRCWVLLETGPGDGSSTSRRSSARATPTTSAARSWGRTGTLELLRPATVAGPARGCPSGWPIPSGFEQRFATAYVNELRRLGRGARPGASAWDGYAAAAVV